MGVLWVVEALVLGFVMRRRGFDGYSWTILGMGFGPIAVIVAASTTAHPRPHDPTLLFRGRWSSGPLDVLVGFDGSAASRRALDEAARLLEPAIGRLTAATVIPIDAGPAAVRAAEQALDAVRKRLGGRLSGVVLRGRPTAALHTYADDEGYDLLVVGTRGRGSTTSLLGRVASGLAAGGGGAGSVPVVLIDGEPAPQPERLPPTRTRVDEMAGGY